MPAAPGRAVAAVQIPWGPHGTPRVFLMFLEATQDEFCWTQTWQVSDLIIWDNRCTVHRRDGFAGHGGRRMRRLLTRGERPF